MFGKGDAVKSLYKDLETGKRTKGLKTKAGDVKYKAEGKPMKVFKRGDDTTMLAGDTPTKSLEAEARKYKSAEEFIK